jgi:hypothetical protein
VISRAEQIFEAIIVGVTVGLIVGLVMIEALRVLGL